MKKFLVTTIVLFFCLLGLLPGIFYVWGRSVVGVSPRPDASCVLTEADAVAAWREFQEEGPVGEIIVLNPWTFVWRLVRSNAAIDEFPGLRVASFVSDRQVPPRRPGHGGEIMIARISQSIWITRNWSGSEILCEANKILRSAPNPSK